MSVVVFLGPTLPLADARARLDADYEPPVAQGDVLRVLDRRPDAIAIIDGYFDHRPAVWHKEILHALDAGVAVYGASSMGALRAAELDAFGMVGVGTIYEAFASGALTDDDEVAVVHATEGDGYRAMSEAMVNVRATLDRAVDEGILDARAADAIRAAAKGAYYPDRSVRLALRAVADDLDPGTASALEAWLPLGRVDRKRDDALALLDRIATDLRAGTLPVAPAFSLASTQVLRELRRSVARTSRATADDATRTDVAAILDELRLADPAGFDRLAEQATLRMLVADAARREGVAPTPDQHVDAVIALRRRLALHDEQAVQDWLAEHDATANDLIRLAAQDHEAAWAARAVRSGRDQAVLDELRRSGRYAALAKRARAKRTLLEERGAWRVASDHGDELADDDGLAADVFDSPAAWRLAVARERTFRAQTGQADAVGQDPVSTW